MSVLRHADVLNARSWRKAAVDQIPNSSRLYGPAHWRRRRWQPIAVRAALQALPAGATLPFKSGGKDRANGHAGR